MAKKKAVKKTTKKKTVKLKKDGTPRKEKEKPKTGAIDLEQVRKLAEAGLIDSQIADILGFSKSSLTKLKKSDANFFQTLKAGKAVADGEVVKALYNRAVGYSHKDCHISVSFGKPTIVPFTKHYAPDVTACIFWLKNRQPEQWKQIVDPSASTEPLKIITPNWAINKMSA